MLFIGIPTLGRPVTLQWAFAFKCLGVPMNINSQFGIVHGKPVAEARNELCEAALKAGAKWIMFIGDDTIPPPHTLRQLLMRMENDPTVGVVGGVYCSRVDPPAPMVFRGNGAGPYWDWKLGEYFEVTGLGMDCTLIRLDVLKDISKPWFRTIDGDSFLEGENKAESWTEDLYFLTRVSEQGKWKIMCDASVIAEHQDWQTGRIYRLPQDTLPFRQLKVDAKKAADLGCGPQRIEIPGHTVVRVDINEAVQPDYRCDLRQLPFADGEFDYVHSSHVLEHFPRKDEHDVIREWTRILKVGGTFHIIVPNVDWAVDVMAGNPTGICSTNVLNVLWGGQSNQWDFHMNGYNSDLLTLLLESHGLKITSTETIGYNLIMKGVKEARNGT